jgi:hypothetical protein
MEYLNTGLSEFGKNRGVGDFREDGIAVSSEVGTASSREENASKRESSRRLQAGAS